MSIAAITDHGGALAAARARYGAGDWLDLSTGINPWPWPVPIIAAEAWRRLPDAPELAGLNAAARHYYGAEPDAPIVAAPGSQALIQCLPRLLRPGRVAITGPTYAEHARCWALAGHAVTEDEASAAYRIVVNPNNPDGSRHDPDDLSAEADRLAAQGGLLIIDEAFADVAPALSMARQAGRDGLCVLRSFGKFFGLAGLRLGFALGPADLIARIEDQLGPWAVAGPALAIGRAAFQDAAWIETSRARLRSAALALDRVLAAAALAPLGGTDLFRLARTPDAAALAEHLARQHILVRRFAWRNDWLRFGLPPDQAASDRLAAALRPA